jgi:hydroxyacylglutathione hydrolase
VESSTGASESKSNVFAGEITAKTFTILLITPKLIKNYDKNTMHVLRTFIPSSLENYNHIVYCSETKQASVVDPFNAEQLVNLAAENQLTISQIWITHEHGDHIRDVKKLKALTNAELYAPVTCKGKFRADHWLNDLDTVTLGSSEITLYLTPGHIPGHGVYVYTEKNNPNRDFIIAGDMLFNAGVGNARSGNVEELYESTERLMTLLSDTTRLYSGHDFIENNLKFVLHHFPNNKDAADMLVVAAAQNHDSRIVTNIGQEKAYNPFLSVNSNWVSSHPELTNLSLKDRFYKIRELRDQW